MNETQYPDVLVVGLGAMGSACAMHLAKQGLKPICVDQFSPPHKFGSTHGETRITRQAIGEGHKFVPLTLRSHQLWRDIERETNTSLFNRCGALRLASGVAHSGTESFLGSTVTAAKKFLIEHAILDAGEIRAHYPQFNVSDDALAYLEPGAGFLIPEACVRAQLRLAKRFGAALRLGERVLAIETKCGQTTVVTNTTTYVPGTTVVTAGPWLPQLIPQLAPQLSVRRQVMHWFEVDVNVSYEPSEFPVFIWQWGEGKDDVFYGFPTLNLGSETPTIKVATEYRATSTTVDAVRREVDAAESVQMYARHVRNRLLGVASRCVKSATCLYTSMAGSNFLIDRLPDAPDVVVVSACSGHGFKHSAAIGEAVAKMVQNTITPKVLSPFAFGAQCF
jgi:sarcosine oxidase